MKHLPFIILSLTLTGCITATPTTPRPTHWANELKADANFYQVDTHLYRSEQPIFDDVPAIHAQAIKTIINLRHTKANDDTALFGDDITLIKEPLITWRIRPTDIARVLYLIEKHQKNGSVLVHCRHGADRTGIVIAMYRIIYQGTSIKDARDEMRHGDYGYHLIWKNLDNLLNDVAVAQVKAELNRLKTTNPIL
ncbi:MAG: tyrosine-protein phosphatase [Moraxella sp.]|nr:tyrosine-protein phosphatase [Moraxella sp.]